MLWFVLLVAAFWWCFSTAVLWNLLLAPSLPKVTTAAGRNLTDPLPLVSVVIAARDEEARIEPTVRRLFAQAGVSLEVIVVDDRSTDATPEMLARLGTEFPRLRALRVDQLPTGWLGKCHACYLGANAAASQWILFTDGDIHMTPDLIHRALAQALADKVDHICLWPTLNCAGAATRGVMLAWAQCIALYAPPWKINRDRSGRPAGIGAFNLVRAEAYRACGGYESLRLEVVDDMRLGLLLRRAGFRQRLYNGIPDLEADWAHSWAGAVRALEKNWFAGVRYNTTAAGALIVGITVVWFGAFLGPWLAPEVGWLAFAGLLSPIIPAMVQTRQAGWGWQPWPFVPLGMLLFVCTGIHSTYKTLRQGGIFWRGTFYPLAELRAGMVR
jgi:glycosyltransferase involved in cell wall biosynthesis